MANPRFVLPIAAAGICFAVATTSAVASFPGKPGQLVARGRVAEYRGVLFVKAPGHALARTGFQIGDIAGSPDGRHVAVSTKYGLFVYRTDGTDRRRLTTRGINTASQLGHVSFAPSGKRLVFEGPASGSRPPAIYTIGLDGRGLHKLGFVGYGPEWSPDGKTITFIRSQPFGIIPDWGDLYSVNASGGKARLLYRPPTAKEAISSVDWSPDSRQLAIEVTDNGEGCEGAGPPCSEPPPSELVITIIDRAGEMVRRLAPGSSPVWSPNGQQIAYISRSGTGRSVVKQINSRGGTPQRLFSVRATLDTLSWLVDETVGRD